MISEVTVPGDEIVGIALDLEEALDGVPRNHAIIALLSVVVTILNPDLSVQEIQDGVRGASEWLCLFLEGRGGDEAVPVVMN